MKTWVATIIAGALPVIAVLMLAFGGVIGSDHDEITSLKVRVTSIENHLSSQTGDIARLDKDVQELKVGQAVLGERIDNLEKHILDRFDRLEQLFYQQMNPSG